MAVTDGAVFLSGEVTELWQKEAAQAVSERFRPVTLRNDIVVRRLATQEDKAG